jgi:aryl-alcohol dehydrogenase-like predicted oxidoreductase
MRYRRLGKTGYEVSEVGFGTWQLGADWGAVDDATALAALHAAADAGITFYDTADVYGDGRSERLVGRFLRERADQRLVVATKMCRRVPQLMENYTPEAFRGWLERSRENLGLDTIPLVQLHCPATAIYYTPEMFVALDELVADGLIAHYGASVEKVEEGLIAIENTGVASIQIIFNVLRQRPAERFLVAAAAADVGVIVRVPLASGLLTGKLRADTAFSADDHRSYNRDGSAFDVGETFAGIPFAVGLEAVERLRPLVPEGMTMAQMALRWILMHDGVSTTIPGAKTPEMARANAAASDLPALSPGTMEAIRTVYRETVKPHVHTRW